jgi:hypothetical protein
MGRLSGLPKELPFEMASSFPMLKVDRPTMFSGEPVLYCRNHRPRLPCKSAYPRIPIESRSQRFSV